MLERKELALLVANYMPDVSLMMEVASRIMTLSVNYFGFNCTSQGGDFSQIFTSFLNYSDMGSLENG
jgi:hypothetical protein